jgi:hypothetical protein
MKGARTMANNVIEIKLSDEDRKLLNEITTGLTVFSHLLAKLTEIPAQGIEIEPQELAVDEKATEQANNTPEPVTAPDEPTEDKAEPSVDLAQIQQKVVQLCALSGAPATLTDEERAERAKKMKADVREIITQYGTKVSDLKDQPEKWDEVWTKLCALEQEG